MDWVKILLLALQFFCFFLKNILFYSANTYWFFVPICAPFLGAVVGVLMYQLMIGHHLEGDVQEKQKEEAVERLRLSNITTNEDEGAWA